MAVKIGHASKDEKGKIVGGLAGDQTGKEVCIRNWYNGSWKFVARPVSALVAEAIAVSCESACKNPNIGYDQTGRNTGLQQAQKANWDMGKIATPCEFDCSSLATACIQAAGVNVWSGGNAMTTSSMKSKLISTGAFEILTEAKYLTGPTYLKRGDVLCKPGSHVVIVLDDGGNVAADKPVSDSDTKATAEPAYIVHPVAERESLWKISAKYLGKGSRYKEIMELNGLTSTVIRVGQKLKIPMK